MTRYTIRKEVNKVGRKVETQWAVVDTLDDRVVVRYASEKEAEALIFRYEQATKE